jgi:hypothetical protein
MPRFVELPKDYPIDIHENCGPSDDIMCLVGVVTVLAVETIGVLFGLMAWIGWYVAVPQ